MRQADDYNHPWQNHHVFRQEGHVVISVAARCRVDVRGKGLGFAPWLGCRAKILVVNYRSGKRVTGVSVDDSSCEEEED